MKNTPVVTEGYLYIVILIAITVIVGIAASSSWSIVPGVLTIEVRYLMSQKQLNRFAVISKLIDGHLTIAEAAVSLGLSERQIIRLKIC